MPKDKGSVHVGPADIYSAPVGTVFPDDFDTPSAPWAHVGYTDAGATITADKEQTDIEVDQEVDPIRTIVTRRRATIATTFAQMEAALLKLAYGGGTVTPIDPDSNPGTGDEYDEYVAPEAGENDEISLIIDGTDDNGRKVRALVPEASAQGGSTVPFRKGEKRTISVSWLALKPDQGNEATPITTKTITYRVQNA